MFVVWKPWFTKEEKSLAGSRALPAAASHAGYRSASLLWEGKVLTARESILGFWFRQSLKWVLWVWRKTKLILVWKPSWDRLFLATVHEHLKPCYSLCRLQKAQPTKRQECKAFNQELKSQMSALKILLPKKLVFKEHLPKILTLSSQYLPTPPLHLFSWVLVKGPWILGLVTRLQWCSCHPRNPTFSKDSPFSTHNMILKLWGQPNLQTGPKATF